MPQPERLDLDVTAADTHAYEAVVTDNSGRKTQHRVRVSPRFLERLGVTDAQEPLLVRASLEYLLEREEPSQIMASFDLSDIERFFPSYPEDIGARI